jgi:hypothetical protein
VGPPVHPLRRCFVDRQSATSPLATTTTTIILMLAELLSFEILISFRQVNIFQLLTIFSCFFMLLSVQSHHRSCITAQPNVLTKPYKNANAYYDRAWRNHLIPLPMGINPTAKQRDQGRSAISIPWQSSLTLRYYLDAMTRALGYLRASCTIAEDNVFHALVDARSHLLSPRFCGAA